MSDSADRLERVRRQFTRQADAYAAMPQTKEEAPLDGLVALVGAQPGDAVLDVACGPGFLTMAFARRCARVQGIDATAALLQRAKGEAARRGLGNVRFALGDAESLPVADAAVDLVACRAAFHHFPRPARVLAEMQRVVRPGGRLLVADLLGAEDPAQATYHDRIERLCDPTHVRALPASEFERLFAASGLAVTARPGGTMEYEASLGTDRCGLAVRREDGRLRFRHTVAAFVLTRDA